MKKKLITILIILAAVCALGTGALTAHAENGKANGDNAETRLLLPSSYEQYLELESPSDFAVSERYIAVAKDSSVYLYDREDSNGYQVFTYTSNVSSLNFYDYQGKTYLYFTSDAGGDNPIVHIDCDAENFSDQSVTRTDINSCSSFVINGSEVSFANASNSVYRTRMDGLNIVNVSEAVDDSSSPACFAVYDGSIYYAKDRILRAADGTQTSWATKHDVASFAIVGGVCYYTSNENYFYRVATGTDDDLLGVGSKIRLCDDGNLYLLQGSSIRRYDAQNGFTGYEIGMYSDSENRLGQNASDISANADHIVVADAGNARVLVAEKSGNGYSYSSVESADAPTLVCAGDDTFAAAFGRTLRIYTYGGEPVREFSSLTTNINGICFSYGKYYVTAASQNVLYIYGTDAEEPETHTLTFEASSVTADIYGNVYVLGDTSVHKLSAGSLEADTSFTCSVPGGTEKILSDYAGNLYALAANIVYKLGDSAVSVFSPDDLAGLVRYSGSVPAESFAFGFESGEVYILSDGFIAVTEKIGISSLDHLSSQDENGKKAYDTLYTDALTADSYTALQLVAVPAQSVAISLDFQGLDQSSYSLPYESYSKTAEERTGVVLARTVNGPIVGFFTRTEDPDSDVNVVYAYEVALILDTDDTLAYSDAAQENAAQSASVVENVGIYKYPQMRLGSNAVSSSEDYTDFLCIGRLEKGAQISLLARVDGAHLDSDYYFVSASVGEETVYGYIPASFVVQYGEAGGGAGGAEYRYARLDRGKSVTLYPSNSIGDPITLSDEEELKIYYNNKDEHGNVYAVYETETGTYAGYIDPDCLYEATPIVMVTLALVLVVAAALIVPVCSLILRKQPTLQP